MLIQIPKLLSAEELAQIHRELVQANWADGRHSAGYLSQAVKDNTQLPDHDPTTVKLGKIILAALEQNALFTSAALPLKMVPPLFNRYQTTQAYGSHIDGAIRPVTGTPHRIRTDLSATLFLSEPTDYDGGELLIQDLSGERSVKLAAGDMILYPGTSVHRVAPVTRGTRLASFFWIQSMVRGLDQRSMLFQIDNAIQDLARDLPDHASLVELAGVYHNLLRCWADT
ncbi:MAG: PKHD-type hydroxylase [Gammaproteobacteria bacterium]|jgi:PKHD-type hydroxylase